MLGFFRCVALGCMIGLSAGACAMPDGKPWSTLDASVHVKWNAVGRIQEDGRFLTAKNYVIRFDELRVTLRELEVATSDSEQIAFDPAQPPPGYTLCHQGHCHHDSGKLIPYDQISAELNQGQASTLLTQVIASPVEVVTRVPQGSHAVQLGACSDALQLCEVGPSDVVSMGLSVQRMVVKAEVTRLGAAEGTSWQVNVDMALSQRVGKQASFVLGADGPEVLRVAVEAELLPTLWDAFDFSQLAQNDGRIGQEAFQAVFELAMQNNIRFQVSEVE